jgi:hypothetical protein
MRLRGRAILRSRFSRAGVQAYLPNIADLNEVSQISLKIDFVSVNAFSIFIEDNTRQPFRAFGTHQWCAFPCVDAMVVTATTAELKPCQIV